jgi:hypothetical protein
LILIIGIFIGFLKFVIGSFETQTKFGPRNTFPYEKSKKLFTPTERSFLGVLEQAVGVEYRVFGKIRLGEVIQPKVYLPNSHFHTALNKVNKKHLDFIICRKNDCEILGVIELDDSRDEKEDRKYRNPFVDMALEVSGIPLLRISAKGSYQVKNLRTLLVDAFALNINEVLQNDTENSEFKGLQETIAQPICEEWAIGESRKVEITKEITEERCPECGSIMRTGKVSRGPHQGKYFFVCTNYPTCKTLKRAIEQVA